MINPNLTYLFIANLENTHPTAGEDTPTVASEEYWTKFTKASAYRQRQVHKDTRFAPVSSMVTSFCFLAHLLLRVLFC